MIRHYSLLLLLIALMVFPGCKGSNTSLQEQGELIGRISVVGNEPFTQLALTVDEKNQVVLLCPPEIDKYLHDHQGQQVRVTYNGTSQVPEGRAVRVTMAKLVTE